MGFAILAALAEVHKVEEVGRGHAFPAPVRIETGCKQPAAALAHSFRPSGDSADPDDPGFLSVSAILSLRRKPATAAEAELGSVSYLTWPAATTGWPLAPLPPPPPLLPAPLRLQRRCSARPRSLTGHYRAG